MHPMEKAEMEERSIVVAINLMVRGNERITAPVDDLLVFFCIVGSAERTCELLLLLLLSLSLSLLLLPLRIRLHRHMVK